MKHQLDLISLPIFYACAFTSGVILTSQGFTFAKWNDAQGIEHFINAHAFLLGAAGIGMLAVSFWCVRLHSRIHSLEKIVQDQLLQKTNPLS